LGTDLQFRGLDSGLGITLNTSPDSIEINLNGTYPGLLPIGFSGIFNTISYFANPNPTVEINFVLGSTVYNTGIMAGSNMTITAEGRYLVSFSPLLRVVDFFEQVEVTYRIRNSLGQVFAEFYCRNEGEDENTVAFTQVINFPPDVYTFSIQAFSLSPSAYDDIRIDVPIINVRLV
jgi:hypothetical protein